MTGNQNERPTHTTVQDQQNQEIILKPAHAPRPTVTVLRSDDPLAPMRTQPLNHQGAIENMNGLLRRDMPRKTDITNYTVRDIDEIAWAVNSTPRKCLGYKTPAEAFLENLRYCT